MKEELLKEDDATKAQRYATELQSLIEKLWRDAGLPEYFLGNGGSNTKLYEFARLCRAHIEQPAHDLQKFKDYVHKRLDEAGIPTHPDGEHSKHGCRVGDRLDIALSKQPVVSLDECVEAVYHAWRTANKCNASERDTEIMITKAALDKAGVKYV